jgi:hypothetical protein
MTKKTTNTRPVDYLTDQVAPWWRKTFVYVRKREVETWKGALILMFVAGVAFALIWSAKTDFNDMTNAAAESTLFFTPASSTITNGDNLLLDATIDPGTNKVSAVSLHITYDKDKLVLDSITPSSMFSLVLAPAVIDNATGTASIDLAVPTTSPSVEDLTTIATFTFHAIAIGTDSPIAFTTASLAAADGEAGNVVMDRVGATVTITEGVNNITPDSTLYFNPANNTIANGSNFSLNAMINPGINHVSAVSLHITYDKDKLVLDAITPSVAFSGILAQANIDNSAGTASIDLGVPTTNPSVAAISNIATFTFHTIAIGTNSPIAFTTASQAAADGAPGNVVIARNGAIVTITANDTTPPVLSNGSPSGALAVDTTQTTVSLSTNEDATCRYAATSGVNYNAMTNFTTTESTAHSFLASGLINGGNYGYFVRCRDMHSNENLTEYLISFSVATQTVTTSDKNSNDDNKSKKSKKIIKREIKTSKKVVSRGDIIKERGKHFSKNSMVKLYFSKTGGGYYPPMQIKTSSAGSFVVTYRINKPAGSYNWYALDMKTGKKSKLSHFKVR